MVVIVALAVACDSSTSPNGQTPQISAATAFSVSTFNACILATTGKTSCWGSNDFGSLGAGDSHTLETTPVAVAGPAFIAISTSDFSSCGLTAGGRVWCWGELPAPGPNRTPPTSTIPVEQPAGPASFVAISTGLRYVCGLDAAGVAYCWGANFAGVLGVGDTVTRTSPTLVAGGLRFKSIGASIVDTCGLTTAGVAYCWGENSDGSLGVGSTGGRAVLSPTPVRGNLAFASLGVGADVTCGVQANGDGYCWGINTASEAGSGLSTPTSYITPTLVAGGVHFKSITPGHVDSIDQSTCGIATDNTAYCWGLNDKSQLGTFVESQCFYLPATATGHPGCDLGPAVIAGLGPVEAIEPGIDHSCALTVAKQVMCWGNNTRGQLGDGTLTARPTPAVVNGLTGLP